MSRGRILVLSYFAKHEWEEEEELILFLRPFRSDSKLSWRNENWLRLPGGLISTEERLHEAIQALGHGVAIRRPGEFVSNLGIGRWSITNVDWRSGIESLIAECSLVLFAWGATEGLDQELEIAVRRKSPHRIAFLISEPDELTSLGRRILLWYNKPMPPLPSKFPLMCDVHGLVTFDADGSPRYHSVCDDFPVIMHCLHDRFHAGYENQHRYRRKRELWLWPCVLFAAFISKAIFDTI